MNRTQTIQRIEAGRVIAIVRGDFSNHLEAMTEAMIEAGLTALEITLNSPDAMISIARLSARFDSQLAIGAGTVLHVDEVERAADAGARFIVSPNRNASVITATRKHNLLSLPGCFTPSEVVEAVEAGADAVKLFPASCLGPAFVKALRGPLPDVRAVPTGGVTPETARAYFAAGAWVVGVGSELISKDALTPGGIERLHQRTAHFIAATKHA
jgi:Entner-Doudoroff aldolase